MTDKQDKPTVDEAAALARALRSIDNRADEDVDAWAKELADEFLQPDNDIIERLRAACNGHPNAKIPWPHRLLHDAITTLKAKDAEIERLEKWQAFGKTILGIYESRNGLDGFDLEDAGKQAFGPPPPPEQDKDLL